MGLTQSQSTPRGGSCVPLVSTAISNPRAWSGLDQRFVELQQGLAAGEDHETLLRAAAPGPLDRLGERLGAGKGAAALPVRSDEIGVAKAAAGLAAVFLAARP